MKSQVSNEVPFKALKNQFMIGPSSSGYTLAYSADGINFTNYSQATPANENCIVNGAMTYGFYKLVGNSGTVDIIL